MQARAVRRDGIRGYFEGRAPGWIRLTSDEPVSGIRRSVRRGRRGMATTLLSWIPDEPGRTVLDAGCGPGELSLRMGRRGLQVTGVELAPTLVDAARRRVRSAGLEARVQVVEGDVAAASGGPWDHIVLMDVLIHYPADEAAAMVRDLAARCRGSILLTVAPRTPLLAVMMGVGSLFPRNDRAPRIRPLRVGRFLTRLLASSELDGWRAGRQQRVRSGFYFSHAVELVRDVSPDEAADMGSPS